MEDDYTIPMSSNLIRSKKSFLPEDEIMELLWQNGQVVMQSQTQRCLKRTPSFLPHKYDDALSPGEKEAGTEVRTSPEHHLLMQEDEMASWLHFDQDFFAADLFSPSTAAAAAAVTNASLPPVLSSIHNSDSRTLTEVREAARPPVPPPRRPGVTPNFPHFSRHRERGGLSASGPFNLMDSTVVDSSDTPSGARCGDNARGTAASGSGGASCVGTSSGTVGVGDGEMTSCDMTLTSSTGGSSASAELLPRNPAAEDRKRKGRDYDGEGHSKDAEFESVEAKKQEVRVSTSTKRPRAAEVHNLSERRRRDRINEKMRALQELIPRCNKPDKASMLDEAIEYLKSLQLQLQMMSMGCCSMVPIMFPGVQQYMIPMGMAMKMGMNRPMMPFPNVMTGAPLPTSSPAASHLGSSFPMPFFHMPHVSSPDPSRVQATIQLDPVLSSLVAQNSDQSRVPNHPDPYQP